MSAYRQLSVDRKVMLWSAIATFVVSSPVLFLGFALTIFSIWFALIPYNLLARIFGDSARDMLVISWLISYTGGLGLLLGAYWLLTRGVKLVAHHGLGVELSSKRFDRVKIACAAAVNVLFFLLMHVLFLAGPGHYP